MGRVPGVGRVIEKHLHSAGIKTIATCRPWNSLSLRNGSAVTVNNSMNWLEASIIVPSFLIV